MSTQHDGLEIGESGAAIRAHIARYADELVTLRRDLHAHPEIGLEEHRTSRIVAEQLESLGYRVVTGLGGTGVVGTLSVGSGRRSVALRADMDALPIEEETNLPYASRHPGRMHACGHDGHTTTLLAAARYLAETRRFDGTVHLIFQPAEENRGGAKLMIDDGLFTRFPCDAVFGMHNMPGLEEGRFGFRPGPFFAGVDAIDIVLKGRGGHGAMPHQAADPVVAGASLVMALQTIVSRNVDPIEPAIVTVGMFRSGAVCNIIPETARLSIGARAFSPEVLALLRRRIGELAKAQAESFGLEAEIELDVGYPVLVNDPATTAFARAAAAAFAGEAAVSDLERPYPVGEDFAFMAEARPATYFVIGQGTGDHVRPLHNPGYDFNDRMLVPGAAFWGALAERFLAAA